MRHLLRSLAPGILVLTLLVLTACQSTATPAQTSTPKATPSPPRLTPTPTPFVTPTSALGLDTEDLRGTAIEVWHPWFGAEASLLESQIADFNASNPWGITVHATSKGNYTSILYNASAAIVGLEKDRPDVVVALPEYALTWDADGGVIDLTPYITDAVYGITAAERMDFPAVFWSQDMIGERRLGMPAQRNGRFLFYNQTWARELGFETPPGTPQEFREQACAANRAMRNDDDPSNDGQGGWIVDTHPMTIYAWLLAFGGGPLQDGNYRFLTPNNIAAFTFLRQLAEDNCAWVSTEETPYAQFASRKALFATGDLGDLPDQMRAFAQASNGDEWTVIPFPGTEGGVVPVYGSSFVLLQTDERRQLAAWLFMRWLLSPEKQAQWVQTTGLFPLRASSLALLTGYRNDHPQWNNAIALLPNGYPQPQLASWHTVRYVLGDAATHIFRVGVGSGQVSAVLAQMDALVSDITDER